MVVHNCDSCSSVIIVIVVVLNICLAQFQHQPLTMQNRQVFRCLRRIEWLLGRIHSRMATKAMKRSKKKGAMKTMKAEAPMKAMTTARKKPAAPAAPAMRAMRK